MQCQKLGVKCLRFSGGPGFRAIGLSGNQELQLDLNSLVVQITQLSPVMSCLDFSK